MANVTLDHLTKIFHGKRGEVRAVDGVDLAIADREFLVLVGPSGCGKTTTLRLIAGLEEITAGTVRIQDRVVNDVPPKDRDIAMVFQHYALYPHMTVFGNMAFGLKMRRTPRKEIRQRVDEVARLLHIEHLLDRRPAALSGGERQRVALGRAIVRRPKVFLFDEPLSNLDARLRVRMRTEIKSLHRTLKTTIIYVTHDQEEAMTLGDRIVILKDGCIQQAGAPLDVYNRPANRFVAGFVGSPSMNFLEGRLEGEGDAIRLVTAVGRLDLPSNLTRHLTPSCGRSVVLGLRPEHLYLDTTGLPESAGAHPSNELTTPDGPMETVQSFPVIAELPVSVVELLGDCIHIHLAVPESNDVVARVSPDVKVSVGDRVLLRTDMTKAHLFSANETGERLN